jgi:hypothetical protein
LLTAARDIAAAIRDSLLTYALFKSSNYIYDTAIELRWLHVETCGCIICASLSTLKPRFAKHLGSFWSAWTCKMSNDKLGNASQQMPRG